MRLYNGYLQHYSAHSPGKSAQQLKGAIYVTLGLLKYKHTSDIMPPTPPSCTVHTQALASLNPLTMAAS